MTSCGGWSAAASNDAKTCFGTPILSAGIGKSAFDDVEDSLCGAAIAFRVVQDSLWHAVGLQVRGRQRVFTWRERHYARKA